MVRIPQKVWSLLTSEMIILDSTKQDWIDDKFKSEKHKIEYLYFTETED